MASAHARRSIPTPDGAPTSLCGRGPATPPVGWPGVGTRHAVSLRSRAAFAQPHVVPVWIREPEVAVAPGLKRNWSWRVAGGNELLVQRIEGQEAERGLHRRLHRAGLALAAQQLAEQVQRLLMQPFALGRQPVLEARLVDPDAVEEAALAERGGALQPGNLAVALRGGQGVAENDPTIRLLFGTLKLNCISLSFWLT